MNESDKSSQQVSVRHSRFGRNALRVLTEGATVSAVTFVFLFLVIAIMRMTYPFELEWMEGASVDHVARILKGWQIYTEPTIDWVPFRYAPLYYYLSAPLAAIFGVGFMPLRLVSIFSTIGCFYLIYQYVVRETRNRRAGLIASGLYAATFVVSGSWFDLARVDSLFMFIILLAVYVFRTADTKPRFYLSGILFALAFFTKQSAASITVVLLLAGLALNWRGSLRAVAACAVTLIIVTVTFNYQTEGWFGLYVFGMGRKLYPTSGWIHGLMSLLGTQLFRPLPIVMLTAFGFLCISVWRRRRDQWYHVALAVAMIGTTYMTRINQGGWTNTFMPACAILAVLFGLAYAELIKYAASKATALRQAILVAVHALVLIQFALLAYDPRQHLPDAADETAGKELIQYLGDVDGEVLLVHHGHYAAMAGKGMHMSYQAMRDFLKTDFERSKRSLNRSIRDAIASERFSLIMTDRDWFPGDLAKKYRKVTPVFDQPGLFLPVAGWRVRPENIYLRLSDSVTNQTTQ